MRNSRLRWLTSFVMMLGIMVGWIGHSYAKIDQLELDLQPDEIAMTFLDLSDGEATLIQTGNETILINTGGPKSFQELRDQLKIYKVNSISMIILTNHDEAYRAHLPALVKAYHVSKILTSEQIKNDVLNQDVPDSIFSVWTSTTPIEFSKGLTCQRQSESPEGDLNFLLRYGNNSLLYIGDQDTFVKFHKDHPKFKARIIKVGNFGSKHFRDTETLSELDPEVSILFKKDGVSFSETLLDQLTGSMVETYNLGQVGNVTIKFSKESYEAMMLNTENPK